MTIEKVLEERGKTHGRFEDNAATAQTIKEVLRHGPRWGYLSQVQREALDMVASKMARIVSGSQEEDHWVDCVGYLTLALKEFQSD